MAAKTLTQLLDEIKSKSDELATVFDEAGDAIDLDLVKSIDPNGTMDSAAKVEWIKQREAELAELNEKAATQRDLLKSSENASQLKTILDLLDSPANALPIVEKALGKAQKSFGEEFVDLWQAEGVKGADLELADFDVKSLLYGAKADFTTAAGWAPETTRTGRLIDAATRPIQVLDLIPTTTTEQAAVVYMEETTHTQAAAETAEGGTYSEAEFALTEQSSPVRKIAQFIPVTDEQLEDVQQVQGYLNNRLGFGLRQRLDLQVLVGDGTAPNLSGILDRSGLQTQALGGDPVPDAVYKAMVKVRVTGRAMPNAVVFHPNDWQGVRLLRTADGIYIWGSPSEAGPATIWGLPVVESDAITENTALVGDYANFSELAIKRGVTVKVSDSHSDYFVNGKQAIRADMRAAFQVYRPAAFCEVTGI